MKEALFMDVAKSKNFNKQNLIIKNKRYITNAFYQVDASNSKILKKNPANYYTLFFTDKVLLTRALKIEQEIIKTLNKLIKSYYQNGKTLIIGLGNEDIISDSLGPMTTKQLIATNQFNSFLNKPKIAIFNPNVVAKTGISSYHLIKMVVNMLKPDTIIIIDALETEENDYLNHTIEINDGGIIRAHHLCYNKEINRDTFNTPIITIGVPVVLKKEQYLLTNYNINLYIDKLSTIIAKSLNKFFLS